MGVVGSKFSSNAAADEGGAIYYDCNPSEADWTAAASAKEEPCILTLGGGNTFKLNRASIGGAVRWTLLEPKVASKEDEELKYELTASGDNKYGALTFTNNAAEIYGSDIAGLARELIRFDNET